ncbi:tail fiber assembly protein [Bordetella ansorpii]|uniref:Tail fiber assembly protein n=1 Tax=Bordetella ansorpii TaxID=288768 RepID=A0A157QPK3_9BORD|nr:hypothetical protein [Bordetella ansorpii]SAI47496.1 tail fiber assembly protein [Bordetella ansorpii]
MQITVYQADAEGIYQYPTYANELSLDPGTFNVPYGAVLTPPPDAPAGQVARARGDAWELVEDHRTERLFRTDLATVDPYNFGQVLLIDGQAVRYPGWGPIPAWLTPIAPASAEQFWDGQAWRSPEPIAAPDDSPAPEIIDAGTEETPAGADTSPSE